MCVRQFLCVDPSTVQRTVTLFEQTGTMSSIQGCHEPLYRKWSDHDEIILLETFERCLLPNLLPYNGINPRSVVILDNASIHHVEPDPCSWCSTSLLPPYSPDLMLIEECFSKVKSYTRSYDRLVSVLRVREIEELIMSAFSSVTTGMDEGL